MKFVAVLLLIFTLQHANAQLAVPGPVCKPARQNIITINGVSTDPDQARINLGEVFKVVSSDPSFAQLATSGIEFNRIYNPTDDIVIDILESATQKLASYTATAWTTEEVLAIASPFEDHHLLYMFGIGKATPEELRQKSQALIDRKNTGDAVFIAQLRSAISNSVNPRATAAISAEHAPRLARLLRAGELITLVGHSQGNLFANELYDATVALLPDPDTVARLKVLNVAPPTSNLPSKISILQRDDLVISLLPGTSITTATTLSELLSVFKLGFLPALLTNTVNFGDPLGHNLIKVYLNDSVTFGSNGTLRSQFVSGLKSLMNDFKPNFYCTELSTTKVQMAAGETSRVTATLKLNGVPLQKQPEYSWTSAVPSVASVASGLVRASAKGQTVVTATDLAFATSVSIEFLVVDGPTISIVSATCTAIPADRFNSFRVVITGTASGPVGSSVVGGSNPSNGVALGTQLSFCNAWTGIAIYRSFPDAPNGLLYCQRSQNDPVSTTFTTTNDVGGATAPTVTEANATLVTLNFNSTLARSSTPLTCRP